MITTVKYIDDPILLVCKQAYGSPYDKRLRSYCIYRRLLHKKHDRRVTNPILDSPQEVVDPP